MYKTCVNVEALEVVKKEAQKAVIEVNVNS
jgi:hypothetical protein